MVFLLRCATSDQHQSARSCANWIGWLHIIFSLCQPENQASQLQPACANLALWEGVLASLLTRYNSLQNLKLCLYLPDMQLSTNAAPPVVLKTTYAFFMLTAPKKTSLPFLLQLLLAPTATIMSYCWFCFNNYVVVILFCPTFAFV